MSKPSRSRRLTRQHIGVRSPGTLDVLAPAAMLADDPPPVAADLDHRLPPDLEFTPVPRNPRSNGLTPARQRLFIKYLAVTGSVKAACGIIGCSTHAVYALKQAPDAETFAAAWERATERGARRVRDTLLDQSINGIPERVYREGVLVAERRLFNTRAQMWIAAHYMPERFAGAEGGIGSRGGRISGRALSRAKEEWRAEQAEDSQREAPRHRNTIQRRFHAIRSAFKRSIANDPASRAAWELLTGDTNWDRHEPLDPEKPRAMDRDTTVLLALPMTSEPGGPTVADQMLGTGGADGVSPANAP